MEDKNKMVMVWYPYKSKDGKQNKGIDVQTLLDEMNEYEQLFGCESHTITQNWYALKRQLKSVMEAEVKE